MNQSKTIACLAGDGVGPELMAAATRALQSVSTLHSLALEELHLPFAGEAVTRFGHALPRQTRAAYRDCDAILAASPDEPALAGVKADLHLIWRVARVHFGPDRDLVVFAPVGDGPGAKAIARAFTGAAARRGRVACVGDSPAWREAVGRERERWGAMAITEPTLGETIVALREAPRTLDVVVTEGHLLPALVHAAAHFAGSNTSVAHGWLPERGPGVFAPGTSEPDDVAGLGVVDPTAILFTTSLLLAEGLRRRSASRTLERAVGEALREGTGSGETRGFTDAVLDLLPGARTDVEDFDQVWR